MFDYKEKYLKYKKKYLNAKYGGSEIQKSKEHKYVASWNLSWAIQENIAPSFASEEDYARKCKKKIQ